jgi:hypothetical protein
MMRFKKYPAEAFHPGDCSFMKKLSNFRVPSVNNAIKTRRKQRISAMPSGGKIIY